MTRRIVMDDALRRAIAKACDELPAEARDRVIGRVMRWAARQPDRPDLVTPKRLAEILGVRVQRLAERRQAGTMPPEIVLEGVGKETAYAYFREDAEALAAEVQRQRTARAEARREREREAMEAGG